MAETGIKQDSKFFVCETPQPDDLDQAGFEALTWVEVENIVTLPDFGFTQNVVTQDYINTEMSQKRKGFKQGGESDLVIGYLDSATGQAALETIAKMRGSFAFKLELSDSPNAVTTTNTIMYSRGIVSGWNFAGGGGEDFDNITTTVGLNQEPIIVAQTAIP